MPPDIHVTSNTITTIQSNLREYLIPGLRDLQSSVDATDIAWPGFGTLGLVFGGKYESMRSDVKQYVEDAITTVENWIDALETIKKNWRDAEDASTVRYQ
jgi:hypothetical protein